jgi:protein TonB
LRTPTDLAEPARVADSAAAPADSAPSVVETDISGQAAGDRLRQQVPPAWQAVVDEARIARDAGELIAPPETNAVELYVAARAMAPEQTVIATELDAVIEQVLALAETALLAQQTEDAAAALQMVRLANPDNPRLPFLDAQVAELALRAQLADARSAIREGRFEDAAAALEAAESLAGESTAEVALLNEELAAARSEQQVDEVLALANQRLGDNALTSPSNNNARYYYELVLSNDPQNPAARQGLIAVASKLVLHARNAVDEGRLNDAERLLRDARDLDPDSSELTASVTALATARAAEAEALRQAELEAEAARLAELEAEAARQAARPAAAGTATGDTDLAAGTPGDPAPYSLAGADAQAAGAAGFAPDPGANTDSEGGSGAIDSGLTADTGGNQAEGSSAQAAEPEYVPISSLTRTNYVVPDYPRSAQRRNITGWVDISFTVTAAGTVEKVGILDSNPGDVFNDVATEAISKWRFEPALENGIPVEKRVAVRLSFDLE